MLVQHRITGLPVVDAKGKVVSSAGRTAVGECSCTEAEHLPMPGCPGVQSQPSSECRRRAPTHPMLLALCDSRYQTAVMHVCLQRHCQVELSLHMQILSRMKVVLHPATITSHVVYNVTFPAGWCGVGL